MTEILEVEMPTVTKTSNLNSKVELIEVISNEIEMAAPNGGKCPHCKDGYLYWHREGSHGKQYYKCGKCGSEVLA